MKRLLIPAVVCAALAAGQNRADATFISLGFANASGALMQFNGDNPGVGQTGSFTFLNNGSGNNIMLVGSDGTGDSFGLMGSISGTFNIGAITTMGPIQSAPVSGTGSFSIADGSGGFLTGNISWVGIETFGATGSLNTQATINLSNVAYSGNTIQDFIDFATNSVGPATLTFQFSAPRSLTQLTQNGVTTNALSFSGSLSNTPAPSAAVMLLTMLPVGFAGMRLRRKWNATQAA